MLELGFSQVKQFDFSWAPAAGAEYYRLFESAAPGEPFVQLGGDIEDESISITMPLHLRHQARYMLRACNAAGCTDSEPVDVVGSLAQAVGYFKASNTGPQDLFGWSVAVSGDGNTLAVGALWEDSGATGIDGYEADDSAQDTGAVYVFTRGTTGQWSQQAYVKASNTDEGDYFGGSVALSEDGSILAVGAAYEDSSATGIGGNQADDSAEQAGAVYVFARGTAGQWSQQAYVKASNTGMGDAFGGSVALSGDGNTLAVGAAYEDSSATGIDGNQADDSAELAGAVYVFERNTIGQWSQQAYVKASNTDERDLFGESLALSGDGNTLAVGAQREDSTATGIDGNQADDSAEDAGAAYVFQRNSIGLWSQQAYVKASNTDEGDSFGWSVALSDDGRTLAVGAYWESSSATGIDGNQADDSALGAGAVYVFERNTIGSWSQQAYVKASNTDEYDSFGWSVALSSNGNTLAIGAFGEDGDAIGIDGDQADDSAEDAGAVYVHVRDAAGLWSQQAYVKASNTGEGDFFGRSVALSDDGDTLAVGAIVESSNAIGIGGDQSNELIWTSGAVYLY